MDPIPPQQGPGSAQPTPDAANVESSEKASSFNVNDASPADATGASQATTAHQRIESTIRQGLEQAKDKEAIRQDVIDTELSAAFGDDVTPDMSAAVQQAISEDPNLTRLFDRLYEQAAGQS